MSIGLPAIGQRVVLAAIAALVSVAMQGFVFNVSNDAFHIPIVLHFAAMPQFAHDPFVQSLSAYSTPVYALLSHVATEQNVEWLFLACQLLARAMTFYAFLMICEAAGVAAGWRTVTALAVLTLSRVLYGPCELSQSDLLNAFFSHTEMAHALALMGLALVLRGRLLLAAAAAGLAFDINAFVGAWMSVPLAFGLLTEWRRELPGSWFRRSAAAAAIALLIAAPVLAWILATREAPPPGLDYRDYLWHYARFHFFLNASSTMSHINFVLIVVSGALALRVLNLGAYAWAAFCGLLAVFAFGIGVGDWSHSVLLLNLHLLRVDALIIMMTAGLIVSVVVRALDPEKPLHLIAALLLVAGLFAKVWFLAPVLLAAIGALDGRFGNGMQVFMRRAESLAVIALLRRLLVRIAARPSRLATTAIVVFAAFAAAAGAVGRERLVYRGGPPSRLQLIGADPAAPQWLDVSTWARAHTRPDAVFLLIKPVDGFRVSSRRSVWVDPKEGAAVMWKPSFHALWSARNRDMDTLTTLDKAIAYACSRPIDYVVRARKGAGSTKAVIVKQNDVFLVADAKASCAARQPTR